VITHRFPLEAFDDAMRVIKSGEAGKVIFTIAD
jgi:threonine 3-dehydrogenase